VEVSCQKGKNVSKTCHQEKFEAYMWKNNTEIEKLLDKVFSYSNTKVQAYGQTNKTSKNKYFAGQSRKSCHQHKCEVWK
jgi:hypothetical protein